MRSARRRRVRASCPEVELDAHFSVAIHTIFDALAWIAAALAGWLVGRWREPVFPAVPAADASRLPVLVFSAAVGAYALGTANLWASGQIGVARSIEGALAGGVVGVEIYKYVKGITGRTGARLAAPAAIGIAVGRIGCYLSGVEDFTYGTPTSLPWAHDFGDGVPRHPVQIYESLAMAAFAAWYLAALSRRSKFVAANGFSLTIGFYAAQRFAWEFIKPYGPVAGPFTIFHLTSVGLLLYAAVLLGRARSGIGTSPPDV
jgi:phosphatidylglycerol---prolipoprotein diacylglyceryl transferase